LLIDDGKLTINQRVENLELIQTPIMPKNYLQGGHVIDEIMNFNEEPLFMINNISPQKIESSN